MPVGVGWLVDLCEPKARNQALPLPESETAEKSGCVPRWTVLRVLHKIPITDEKIGNARGNGPQSAQLPILACHGGRAMTRGQVDVDQTEGRAGMGGVGARGEFEHLHSALGVRVERYLGDDKAPGKLGSDDHQGAPSTVLEVVVEHQVVGEVQ